MAEKLFIKNRKGQKIAVILETAAPQYGLAFVMHGLGGFKEQPHIMAVAQAFHEHNCAVVRFDTTNTFGESDGDYADATTTNYYEDLEDVIAWARTQPWYQEPFFLAGHSLGGISTALYAEKHPEKIKALAPLSAVVSGELTFESFRKRQPEKLNEAERTGWLIEPSNSKPGTLKKLKWNLHIKDRLKYDLLPNVQKLAMPVLLVVGELDTSTPAEHQQILYDKLPGRKELHIIKGAPHTFREQTQINELKQIVKKWLATV